MHRNGEQGLEGLGEKKMLGFVFQSVTTPHPTARPFEHAVRKLAANRT